MAIANNTSISTYHLSDNPDLYEPARSNAFEFYGPKISRLLKAGVDESTATDNDYIANIQDIIKLSVDGASIPHFDLDVIEIRRGNSVMKFAGVPSFDQGSLRVNDYVGARTKDALNAWHAAAYDVATDVVKLASNYKYDCKLVEYTPDYSSVLRTWVLKNCWVKTVSESDFSHTDTGKRMIDVTLIYDRAIPQYNEVANEG